MPSESDMDLVSVNKYNVISEGVSETEHFFFGGRSGGHFLHYYDKTTGTSDFFCADPSCTHDSTNCGAYSAQVGLVSFYEGKRYWVTVGNEDRGLDSTLWCGDLGGGNRQRVKRLSYEAVGQYAPQRNVIYQGKLYMMGRVNTVDGVKVGMRVTLLRTSLDSDETVETLFDESYPHGANPRMLFVGDSVYFGVNTWSSDGVENEKIVKINVETLETETVYEEYGVTEMLGDFWVTEDGKIYIPGEGKFWRIENGVRTLVCEMGGGYNPAYIDDGIVIQNYAVDGIRYTDIRDLDGNTLYAGNIFPNGVEGITGNLNTVNEYGLATYGGDPEKLLVSVVKFPTDQEMESGQPVNNPTYFLMLDLKDNMKPTLLWTATK